MLSPESGTVPGSGSVLDLCPFCLSQPEALSPNPSAGWLVFILQGLSETSTKYPFLTTFSKVGLCSQPDVSQTTVV